MLRTIIFYLLFFPWTAINLTVAILGSLLGSNNAAHRVGIVWGKGCAFLAGLKVNVIGAEYILRDQPVIYVSNHQSNFDIPILYAGCLCSFAGWPNRSCSKSRYSVWR